MAYGRIASVATLALAAALLPGTAAQAEAGARVVVVHVGQISEQDVPPQPGSEPDTLVEPDVAVSPVDPDIAVAVSHDGRFPDGGAVGIGYAWTHDGGRTWRHAPLPGLTVATGGTFERASDPVVAFGPDGTVYVSTLLLSAPCSSGIAISRSTNGGRTFQRPLFAHRSDDCAFSDDKNWLVVDNGRHSPHRGRLYQFWTPFLSDAEGTEIAAPQVVRWSDDRGRHWGPIIAVSDTDIFTQNSQPMIRADGTIVDTYANFGDEAGEDDLAGPDEEEEGFLIVARTSRDGGRTWSAESTVTRDGGFGPEGIRCCVPSATIDPVTGLMYLAWDSADPGAVRLSRSLDGRHWSAPVQVNRDDREGIEHVNADVTAYAGRVLVSYASRDTRVAAGRFLQQQVAISADAGRHFGRALPLGPPSDLRFGPGRRDLPG
jgi:hypothetical protein